MGKKFDLKQAIASSTGMLLDGIFGSEQIDSSGEILSVEGCDISTLDVDGVANWEHLGSEDKGHTPSQIVGRVIYAKKIFKANDCDNEREKKFWEAVGKVPFIYGVIRLYDGAGHAAAADLAAQIRDAVANDETILARYSVEGSTLTQKGNRLEKTIARKIAITVKPCNRTAVSGMLADPKAPEGFVSRAVGEDAQDLLAGFEKSEHPNPAATKLGGAPVIEYNPILSEKLLDANPTLPQRMIKFEVPGEEAFQFHQSGRNLGGAGRKDVFQGPDHTYGNLWLVKPSESKGGDPEPFRAAAQEAYSRVAEGVLGAQRAHPVRLGTVGGEISSLQPFIEGTTTLRGITPDSLTPEQAEQVASHHLVDWLMSNHDAHEDNFILRPDGAIIGIDTEQSFRYANEDMLDNRYHPNEMYGADEPYYNHFWRAFEEGRLDFDPRKLKPYIDAADRIPTEEFIRGLQPYMDYRKMSPDRRRAFVNMLAKRKEGLGENFRQFIEKMVARKTGQEGTFDWEAGWQTSADREMAKSLFKQKLLAKALAAGVASGAPSTLTQGAALQREDPSLKKQYLVNQLKAALRDYNKAEHGDLKDYLTDRLPEADDEFMEHFESLVDEYKLRKAEEEEEDTSFDFGANVEDPDDPGARWMVELQAETSEDIDRAARSREKAGPSTAKAGLWVRGRKAPKPRNIKKYGRYQEIDTKKGQLRSAHGVVSLYNPHNDMDFPHAGEAFEDIIRSRKLRAVHDIALDEWFRLHTALRDGKLPKQALHVATLFALLSPNTAVPEHEFSFGQLYDILADTQLTPDDPSLAEVLEAPFEDSEVYQRWSQDASRTENVPENLPRITHEYYRDTIRDLITATGKAKDSKRRPGELIAIGLMADKFKSISRYPLWAKEFENVVDQYNIDGRGASRAIMEIGHRADLWKLKIGSARRDGKPHPGEFTEAHPFITYGAAQKITRYVQLLIGAGNVLVPDTHFVRHIFGLDSRDANDAMSQGWLQQELRSRGKSHLMEGVEHWYRDNHPAVKRMKEHPKYGEYFTANPDQALAPAFWLHWMAIPYHEYALGIGNPKRASTGRAFHLPYFEAIRRLMGDPNQGIFTPSRRLVLSEEGASVPLIGALDAAMRVAQWNAKYGPAMASMLYFAHIVPKIWPRQQELPEVESVEPKSDEEE
jgi:hypothetical protein